MQILLAPTEDFVLSEKTAFSADEAAGETTLSVENTNAFSSDDFVIIDQLGSESSELRKISSVSTNSITLSVATKIAHYKDAPIQVIRYDKRKFYRSTSENGSYSHLAAEGSPVDITPDQPEGTEFEDANGISSSWYKATYYNSVTMTETSLSDATATKAGDAEHYTSIYKIRCEAGFQNNDYIGSDLIDRYRTALVET